VRVAALLPAAGSGHRLGLGPKALVRLGERTILEVAAGALEAHVDELVIGAPAGLGTEFRRLVPGALVVRGAASRKATVSALLAATAADIVVIHDAARPFLPAAVLHSVIRAAGRHGAASAAQPLADTIVRRDGADAPAREALLAVQTPQAFHRELLLEAHAAGCEATDDAGLVARLGRQVEYVPGSAWLFKITAQADLELARALLPGWEADTGDH